MLGLTAFIAWAYITAFIAWAYKIRSFGEIDKNCKPKRWSFYKIRPIEIKRKSGVFEFFFQTLLQKMQFYKNLQFYKIRPFEINLQEAVSQGFI